MRRDINLLLLIFRTNFPIKRPNYRKKKYNNTVKPPLSGHLRDLPKRPINGGCPLNTVCKNCTMFNFQRLLCTVIKFHVVKEAKEAVLYVVQDSRYNLQFIDSQMYWFTFINRLQHVFQGRNPILLLFIRSAVRLIEVINNKN